METKNETFTRTVVCPLETSNTKNKIVQDAINEWQTITRVAAERMPSIDEAHWRPQDVTLSHFVKNEFPDTNLFVHDARQAVFKVAEAFQSWKKLGRRGDYPIGQFGDSSYIRLCGCCRDDPVVQNDRGFGLQVSFEPWTDPVWFHMNTRPYHEQVLERVVDESMDARSGTIELRFDGNDQLAAHVTVTENVEVVVADSVDTVLGVDLGERAIYASAIVGRDGAVLDANITPGKEFRHHRDRITQKIADAQERGNLSHVIQKLSGQRARYTDHITHVCSKEIVAMAEDHHPAVIVLEDLRGHRSQTGAYEWPEHQMREKIIYKATERGIPVKLINPANTSIECNKCGVNNADSRDGNVFQCTDCGYECHADLNAAVNIANRYRNA